MLPPGFHSPIRDTHPHGVNLPLRDVLRFMVTESDGTASDVLLRLAGGPQRVAAYLRGLSVRDVKVATPERAMAVNDRVQYRNWATPAGLVSLLVAFYQGRGLSPDSRARLLQLMTDTTTFPHRLKGLLAARHRRRAQDGQLRHVARPDPRHERRRARHATGRASSGGRGPRLRLARRRWREGRRDCGDRPRGVGSLDKKIGRRLFTAAPSFVDSVMRLTCRLPSSSCPWPGRFP